MSQTKINKILFDARPVATDKLTGVGFYTKGLIEALAKNYPDVTFVGHYFLPYGKSDANFKLPAGRNISYKKSRIIPEKLLNQLRRFGLPIPFEFLIKTRGNIILFPAYLSLPSVFKTPSVITIHDLAYLNNPETLSRKNRQDLEKYMPSSIYKSSLILTVSEYSKQEIIKHYKIDSSKIIVHGLPPAEKKDISSSESLLVLKKLNIQKKFLLFLGTLEPRKNVAWLIKAFIALPENIRKEYNLVLAGGLGWNSDEIREMLENPETIKSGVVSTGYVTDYDRAALLSNCEVLVMASKEEGFGMPILEAAQYGKASLLSDIPVFHEVAGDGAIYFDNTSYSSFNTKLTIALKENKELGEKASENLKKFSWNEISQSVMTKLNEII